MKVLTTALRLRPHLGEQGRHAAGHALALSGRAARARFLSRVVDMIYYHTNLSRLLSLYLPLSFVWPREQSAVAGGVLSRSRHDLDHHLRSDVALMPALVARRW